jgi:hypothetical protein
LDERDSQRLDTQGAQSQDWNSYAGPFAAEIIDGGDTVHVGGDGYVWAGNLAEFHWPGSETDTIDATALADGTFFAYLQISVDDTNGYFTADNKPTLYCTSKYSWTYVFQDTSEVHIIIAEFEVVSGRAIWIKQRWQGDIYVPVQHTVEYSSGVVEDRYDCTLQIEEYRASPAVTNSASAAVEVN